MSVNRISKSTIKFIRNNYLTKALSRARLSTKISVSLPSIDKYIKEFIALGATEINLNVFPKKKKKVYPPTRHLRELRDVLPGLIANLAVEKASVPALFNVYREACPTGYAYDTFRKRFATWHKETNTCVFAHKKVTAISPQDQLIFNRWLSGNDLLLWRYATVLTDSFKGVLLKNVAEKYNSPTRRCLIISPGIRRGDYRA